MSREPTEMEQRVNLAIRTAFFNHVGQVWPEDVGLDLARAAICAMREPTAKMVDAGHPEDGPLHPYYAWLAMIDSASPPDASN